MVFVKLELVFRESFVVVRLFVLSRLRFRFLRRVGSRVFFFVVLRFFLFVFYLLGLYLLVRFFFFVVRLRIG